MFSSQFLQSLKEFHDFLAIKATEATNENIVSTPVIVIVGSISSAAASFYSVVGQRYFKTDSLIHALEYSYELFFVLRLTYTQESSIVWTLLQIVFIKITSKGQKIPFAVNKIINFLELARARKTYFSYDFSEALKCWIKAMWQVEKRFSTYSLFCFVLFC